MALYSTSDLSAKRHLEEAVRAFTLNFGDTSAHLKSAEESDPDWLMPRIMTAGMLALSNDASQLASGRKLIEQVNTRTLSNREVENLKAVQLALNGSWPSAVASLDKHLMKDPQDLCAHQIALRLDGYMGRFHRVAARSARALPFWSKDEPNYAIMRSFYGFGLEECGDYARAEDVSREAAELEPYGYWPHHAVSHVLEMTGRPREGVKWMEERLQYWADSRCNNRVHIWWHKALYHLELGELNEALAIYDNEILGAMRPVGTQLCNATALLWRLETLDCDVGERWTELLPMWQRQLSGMSSPFNEIHAAMTALRAGDEAAFDVVIQGMQQNLEANGELAVAYRELALPVATAMRRFLEGRYDDAVDVLIRVEPELWRMGGSVAQRDLVSWTMVVAAVRSRQKAIAASLINERLALRPDSYVNQAFERLLQN